MHRLDITDDEMCALQAICCTADLTRITEATMPGLATLFAKIYNYKEVKKKVYEPEE